MPFFEPLPEPPADEAPDMRHYDWPHQQPDHWLPGVGDRGVLLYRDDRTAVLLVAESVFPRGIGMSLEIRVEPSTAEDLDPLGYGPWKGPLGGPLRIGLEWPDGSRAEAGGWHGPGRPVSDGPFLDMRGGGGGGLSWGMGLWLRPLPPAGPVMVHLLWERRGIPETSVAWDLAPVVALAEEAEELWHLDPAPMHGEGAGWMSYGPYGAGFSTLTVEDPEQDAPGEG